MLSLEGDIRDAGRLRAAVAAHRPDIVISERMWQDGVAYAEAWNFGPPEDDAWPVSRLFDELGRLWGENVPWRRDAHSHPAEAAFLRLDCSKTKARLGWAPAPRAHRRL